MPVMTRVPLAIVFVSMVALLAPCEAFAQSTLVKLADAGSGGATSHVALATLFDTRFVTATVSGNASLEITSWDVSREGHFAKGQSIAENGASSELALMSLGSTAVAAAFAAETARCGSSPGRWAPLAQCGALARSAPV